MLTEKQYIELWGTYFSNITNQNCPDFEQYIIRENMLEDYLDLFRGKNTRVERGITSVNQYYEHPFFDVNGNSLLNEKPCIKYILIAEAAPQVNDNVIKYIYNKNIAGGTYITAPLNAFNTNNVNNLNTTERLLELARNGVLIIDLFPFALDYNEIREQLNNSLVTDYFFNNEVNFYSVTNRIYSLIIENLTCPNFKNQINSVFIAPPKISHYLAYKINNINLFNTLSLNFKKGKNNLLITPIYNGPSNQYYNLLIPANSIISGLQIPLSSNENLTIRVPIYACTAYSGSGTVPHSFFIIISLINL